VLITAIGVSLLLQNVGQRIFGANPRSFPSIFPVHQFHFGGIVLSSTQILVFVVTLVLLFLLRYIVLHTRIGTAMRALSFNPTAARWWASTMTASSPSLSRWVPRWPRPAASSTPRTIRPSIP
jgi:branched-subunit amino acid ABC-type transport system permease component